jgi:hypothetical protein
LKLPDGRFLWKEVVKASINIQMVRIRLVISVDWEQGTGMDHIAPAPTAYPVTQEGYNTVLCFLCINRMNATSPLLCVNNNAKEINPVFVLRRLKINHMRRSKLSVYS